MAETEGVDQDYRRYIAEIELYEKEFKPWETRGKKILKLYKDSDNNQGKRKRFNVLWSNVETLKPALYARDPQPIAERRFKDADPIGRTASEVLERCIAYTVDCQNFGQAMRQVVSDRLLPGRGTTWTRYQPTFEGDGEAETVKYEEAVLDYVYWEDFGHNVARTWDEVYLVWRRVYMTRSKLVKRFGADVGNKIPLDYTPRGLKDEKTSEDIKKACIYELWDRDDKQVLFLSKGHPKIIEKKPDPLELTNTFPCPRPLYATLTTDSLMPVADYALYQTQAQELEELTVRIDGLQEALKLRGAYDSSAPELSQILAGAGNKLIPVANWAKFSEKGGIEGAIQFVPIKEVAETLIALYEAREKSKHDLYEITGLADIIRGNSEPEETATAQQIKGRFAVLRISDSQAEVQRYARDATRQLGEVIAEHFSLETIKAISGVKLMTEAEKQQVQQQLQLAQQEAQQTGQQPKPVPDEMQELLRQPSWEQVYALLSDQVLREFRIDIETDSTIRTDEDADRMARTEFLDTAGNYLDKAVTATQLVPELAPLMGELLMFGVRSFRSSRSLEPAFEDAMKKIQAPKPPKPDPELQKEQVKAQSAERLAQMQGQIDAGVEQHKQEMQARENMQTQQLEDARSERDGQREMALEQYKAQLTAEVERYKAQLKAETDLKVAQVNSQQEREARDHEAQTKEREYQVKDTQSQRDSATKLELERMKGAQSEQDRNFQAEQAKETERSTGEKTAKRDNTLASVQKLVEALAQLKGANVH